MTRRRYLIAYDIADPKRLRFTFKTMKSYGERLQYSVFLCDLSIAELALWERDIRGVLELSEDSIIVIDLGSPGSCNIRAIGVPRSMPLSGPTIV